MEQFTLLYPPGSLAKSTSRQTSLTSSARHDLRVDQIIVAFSDNRVHQKEISGIFTQVIGEPQVIRYRQDILADLLSTPALVDRFFLTLL